MHCTRYHATKWKRCPQCREVDRKRKRPLYEACQAEGICSRCAKVETAPGEACEACREIERERYRTKPFGQCLKCTQPAELGRSSCGRHLELAKLKARRRRAERRKARGERPDSRAAILQVLGRGDQTLEGLAQEGGISTRTVLRWIRKMPEVTVVEATETRAKVYRYEKPRL